jgi:BlaI family penicillinase repressor
MDQIPQISDAEWQVMKVIWAKAPVTANEVIRELEAETQWKPKTIKTLLGRLVKKNAVSYKTENRTYIYYPTVTEEECIKLETQSFVKRVYDGSINLLLTSFIKEQKLTREEIEELKQILDENRN